MGRVKDFIRAALRVEIARLLATFPENQTSLFARVFPGEVEKFDQETLSDALALCYRTEVINAANLSARSALPAPTQVPKP